MKEKQLLIAARDFLKEKNWCQGFFARDKKGNLVYPKDKKACSWCAVGAMAECSDGDFKNEARTLDILRDSIYGKSVAGSVAIWNDSPGRTKEEVIAEFDKAISKI